MENKSIEKLEQKILSFPEKAKLIKINDQQSLEQGHDFLLLIKQGRHEVNITFDPIIKKAHETHKETIAKKHFFEMPLITAENIVKPLIASYIREQERLKREAEEKIRKEREEAEKKIQEEEEKRLQAALKAEQEGNKEEAEKIIEEMPKVVEKPAPFIPFKKPKLGGTSIRKIWKFEIEDEDKIPREYMKPDVEKIGAYVRFVKEKGKIPGVRIYSEDSVATRIV